MAALSWWPIATNLGDSWPYATHALHDPFDDPMHPAGYSLALAAIGVFTRDVGLVSVLQNLMGIASALILFAGVRRLCGSPWPGLLGAAVILLGADQVFLERTIMSETFFTLLLSATIYATARALESPERWYPWPLAAAALGLAMGITRSAGLVLLPLIALALAARRPPALARPLAAGRGLLRPGRRRPARLRERQRHLPRPLRDRPDSRLAPLLARRHDRRLLPVPAAARDPGAV